MLGDNVFLEVLIAPVQTLLAAHYIFDFAVFEYSDFVKRNYFG